MYNDYSDQLWIYEQVRNNTWLWEKRTSSMPTRTGHQAWTEGTFMCINSVQNNLNDTGDIRIEKSCDFGKMPILDYLTLTNTKSPFQQTRLLPHLERRKTQCRHLIALYRFLSFSSFHLPQSTGFVYLS